MTNKVDIRRLDSVTKNDTTATAQINDNFAALQEAIENTLSRDGTGPNYMDADLDMNSYRIINSSDPVDDNDIVNLRYVEERIGGAVDAANSASASASQAASSAQSALVSSTNAINTLRNAENTINQATELLTETQEYVDEAKESIDEAITAATDEVKQQALDAAQEVITGVESDLRTGLQPLVTEAGDYASLSRTWATGTDNEVQAVEPDEHSSRGYADLAMAIANTPEDVPVDISTLLALDVIKGPKGDKGDSWNGGDITNSINVINDSNHPIQITGMAGASASGYQIIDSNGAGDSDFEHLATGDRYITRIANHNSASDTTAYIDLYQSNVGRSVLDLSNIQTILAPALLGAMYPVGSIYITTNATCPIADLGVGTWELVAEDRVLQGAGTRGTVGTTVDESLPNIKGEIRDINSWIQSPAYGAFSGTNTRDDTFSGGTGRAYRHTVNLDASLSSSTYQDNAPVQQDAYLVNIFRRIQ